MKTKEEMIEFVKLKKGFKTEQGRANIRRGVKAFWDQYRQVKKELEEQGVDCFKSTQI